METNVGSTRGRDRASERRKAKVRGVRRSRVEPRPHDEDAGLIELMSGAVGAKQDLEVSRVSPGNGRKELTCRCGRGRGPLALGGS
jgi:hypothetical protein